MLQTEDQYYLSLRDGRRVFYRGQPVEDLLSHPELGPAIRHAAVDFRMAHDPQYRDRAVVTDEDGTYSRFYHIPKSSQDLKKRRDLIALSTRLGGTVVPLIHEIGTDALFGLMEVTQVMDHELGTRYSERVRNFWQQARDNDYALAVAQTDVKGDRSKRPSDQPDPDMYLRIVKRTSDGIVVRGAKVHTSVSINANWLIALPTREMREADKDYAAAFVLPVNTPGLTLITSPFLSSLHHDMERPISSQHKMVESFTWFDDVFIPHEQVFLNGEWQFAGMLAKAFVEFHRFTAVSYKLPLLELITGVSALLAKYNGIDKARHVQNALSDLVLYEMTVRSILDNAADRGEMVAPGVFRPHIPLVNLAKYHFATGLHQAFHHVQDIAGGLLVTAPGEEDLSHPELGPVLRRYLQGRDVGGENRLKALYLASDLVASDLAAYHLVLAVHAEGSIEAEKMTAVKSYPWEQVEAWARQIAGISD